MPKIYRPSAGNITNAYRNESSGPDKLVHRAVDFGWGNGLTVVAAMPGKLTFDNSVGYGLRGSIAHPDGSFTRYAHLASGSREREVEMGEEIGVMGDSGTLTRGVHLHFEYIVNGKKRDPTPYFTTERPPIPAGTIPPTIEKNKMSIGIILNVVRPGVGVNYFFITPQGVWMGPETSVSPSVKTQQDSLVNLVAYGYGLTTSLIAYTAPVLSDTAALTQLKSIASLTCGMPSNFAITPTNPFIAASYFQNAGATALSAAQNDALMGLPAAIDNLPTNGEFSGVITNQYNLIRTGATSDKSEILSAIGEIPASGAPQNLTVTLTGTAEAAQ